MKSLGLGGCAPAQILAIALNKVTLPVGNEAQRTHD
jgi:hypothetical protein